MNTRRTASLYLAFSLCIFLWLTSGVLHAQSIENVRATYSDKLVRITYDLNGTPDQKFQITIYGSHNNYSAPLRLVTGAVGEGQTAGKAKTIEWRVGEDLVTFTGQIVFRLRGEVMAGPLSIQSPTLNSSLKLGKQKEIKWTGGQPTQQVRIELVKDGNVVRSINNSNNTGIYLWTVPKDIEKGNYAIRISSGSDSASTVPIEIKKGLPLWAILAPIAVIGGVVVYLMLPPKEPVDNTPPLDDLPDAPAPVD
jgi:hypothetical protein